MMKLLVLRNLKGLVAVVMLCMAGQLSANTLFNVVTGLPDIQSQDLNLTYDSGLGNFNIQTNPGTFFSFNNYATSLTDNNIFNGTFMLDFSIDTGTGTVENASSFSIVNDGGYITGSLAGTGAGDLLLGGDVTAFDFGINSIGVLLNITSGVLFSGPSGFGSNVFTEIDLSGFSLSSMNLNESSLGADTRKVIQQVPEPSILFLFAIAGLSFFRKPKQLG